MATSTKPLVVYAPLGAEADPKALAQIELVMEHPQAVAGVLCADHHLGYSMPIGGVVRYEHAVSPSGVGFDIACGNKAVRTNLQREEIAGDLAGLMTEIEATISFGMGRNRRQGMPEPDFTLFDTHASTVRYLEKIGGGRRDAFGQKARAQLGTVGAGNHYVDLLADKDGWVWVANHFGSRGLGHTIATGFLNLAHDHPFDHRGKEREEATVLDDSSELGAFYLDAMHLAGDYAYVGRDYVIEQVLRILGADPTFEVHNHHNFAWRDGESWIVRKGATPLTDEPAFIGGSMGAGAVIVRRRPGVDVFDLGSAPHGAGRVMSRTKAAGKQKRSTRYSCGDRDCDYWITPQQHDAVLRAAKAAGAGRPMAEGVYCKHHPDNKLRKHRHIEHLTGGVVDWPAVQAELKQRRIELRGAGADEAPEVYKDLDDVIAAHPNIEVLERLRVLGVVMAGPDVVDPFKD